MTASKPALYALFNLMIRSGIIGLPFWVSACDFVEPLVQRAAIFTPDTNTSTEIDVLRPDIYDVTAFGLWNGLPSFGDVWVAHVDVELPERVLIANVASGATVVGQLFRRQNVTQGPAFQVSAEAAAALGIDDGKPTELRVTAIRDQRVRSQNLQEDAIVAPE